MNLVQLFPLLILVLFSGNGYSEEEIVYNDTYEFEEVEHVTKGMGTLKGLKVDSGFGTRKYYKFLSLPYALPPKGDLRFRAPVAYDYSKDDKDKVRDCTLHGYHCPQIGWLTGDTEGYEDCLTANVFTPQISKVDVPFPVVVWIHGGAYQFESGETYSPDYMMEEDGFVMVTFNFRLGVLGFLSTEDDLVPGNAGLKDQVALLKWVQTHIHEFNGDPKRVTLMGGASGGAAVHLHMISPMSRGLFHQAVSQSGTALSPWAISRSPQPRDRVNQVARLLNCTEKHHEDIRPYGMKETIDCLREASFHMLTLAQNSMMEWYMDPWTPMAPVVEKSSSETPFLTDTPYRHITRGEFAKDIPWILGVNSQEGLLHAADILNVEELSQSLDDVWENVAPITLNYRATTFDPYTVNKRIRDYYYNSKGFEGKTGVETMEEVIQMYSDRYFHHGIHHSARLMAKNGGTAPIYPYYFSFRGERSVVEKQKYNSMDFGVCHYDQYQYMFLTPYFNVMRKGHKDEGFAKEFVRIFTNFAKFGPKSLEGWTRVSQEAADGDEKLTYNVIGSKLPEISQIPEPFTDGVEFWNSLGLMELGREMGFFLDKIDALKESNETAEEVVVIKDEL